MVIDDRKNFEVLKGLKEGSSSVRILVRGNNGDTIEVYGKVLQVVIKEPFTDTEIWLVGGVGKDFKTGYRPLKISYKDVLSVNVTRLDRKHGEKIIGLMRHLLQKSKDENEDYASKLLRELLKQLEDKFVNVRYEGGTNVIYFGGTIFSPMFELHVLNNKEGGVSVVLKGVKKYTVGATTLKEYLPLKRETNQVIELEPLNTMRYWFNLYNGVILKESIKTGRKYEVRPISLEESKNIISNGITGESYNSGGVFSKERTTYVTLNLSVSLGLDRIEEYGLDNVARIIVDSVEESEVNQ